MQLRIKHKLFETSDTSKITETSLLQHSDNDVSRSLSCSDVDILSDDALSVYPGFFSHDCNLYESSGNYFDSSSRLSENGTETYNNVSILELPFNEHLCVVDPPHNRGWGFKPKCVSQ